MTQWILQHNRVRSHHNVRLHIWHTRQKQFTLDKSRSSLQRLFCLCAGHAPLCSQSDAAAEEYLEQNKDDKAENDCQDRFRDGGVAWIEKHGNGPRRDFGNRHAGGHDWLLRMRCLWRIARRVRVVDRDVASHFLIVKQCGESPRCRVPLNGNYSFTIIGCSSNSMMSRLGPESICDA